MDLVEKWTTEAKIINNNVKRTIAKQYKYRITDFSGNLHNRDFTINAVLQVINQLLGS